MSHFLNDLKYALRQLRKSPGFALTVIAMLALAIGANTVMFSVVQGVLLSPLPYEAPGQIVQVWEDPSGQGGRNAVSGGAFLDWHEHNTVFDALSVIQGVSVNLTGDGHPLRVSGRQVSADYLRVFRIRPLLGRGFLPEEEILGNDTKVVLLSHALWQNRYGADPTIVNQSIRLGAEPFRVVGVLPPLATRLDGAEFLTPFVFGSEAWHDKRGDHRLQVVGRLKPEVTFTQADTTLRAQRQQIASLYPERKRDWSVTIVPLHEQVVGPTRPIVHLLWGTVAFVLLIACMNVANLFLVRSASREKEMAIRTALGAGRVRVIRQVLTESVLLAFISGSLGICSAIWGIRFFTQFSSDILPGIQSIGLNVPVLLFSLAVSLGTGLLFGYLPAIKLSQSCPNTGLREGRQNSAAPARLRFANMLVVSEVALALVLLIGAGLLYRSFSNLMRVAPGFNPARTLTFDLSLPAEHYPSGQERASFFHQMVHRLQGRPEIEAVGVATTLPMTGANVDNFVTVEGRADQPQFGYPTSFDFVAGDYFRAMGIALYSGRLFREQDNNGAAPRVTILNQALAQYIFPDEDPLGQHVRIWGQSWTIAGVVGNVRQDGLHLPARRRLYFPQAFTNWDRSMVVCRVNSSSTQIETIRSAIAEVDADVPISNVRSFDQIMTHSLSRQHLLLMLLGIFAGVGLALAIVGLYGVVAYIVSRRRREIGIRMALGAEKGAVVTLLVRHGLFMSLGGTAIGLLASLALTRLLTRHLFGIGSMDPVTYAGVSLSLIVTTLVACLIPARRAAKIDPMEALRYE